MSMLSMRAETERWPLTTPFRITGHTFDVIEVLLITLARDGHMGRGEATGIYYKNDKPEGMIRQIEALRTTIERGIGRDALQQILPPGGARNALDCALWD